MFTAGLPPVEIAHINVHLRRKKQENKRQSIEAIHGLRYPWHYMNVVKTIYFDISCEFTDNLREKSGMLGEIQQIDGYKKKRHRG